MRIRDFDTFAHEKLPLNADLSTYIAAFTYCLDYRCLDYLMTRALAVNAEQVMFSISVCGTPMVKLLFALV